VVTFDNPNNIVRLFVDGVQIGTLSTTSNPDNTGNQPLRIAGNSQSLTEDFFIGQLDEVGVWDRALTTTEITSLMNTGAFPSGFVYKNSFGLSTFSTNDTTTNDTTTNDTTTNDTTTNDTRSTFYTNDTITNMDTIKKTPSPNDIPLTNPFSWINWLNL
jgi:hypothetical protein